MASPQIKERCLHLKTIKDGYLTNCIFCGLRILDEGKICYKSNIMNFPFDVSSHKVHERMKNQSIFLPKKTNFYFGEYLRSRRYLIEWVMSIGEKLGLSINCVHLSIFYMDCVMDMENIHYHNHQIFFVCCLMLAAKSIEKDDKIPFISTVKKVTLINLRNEEFKKVEASILKLLDWFLQKCTPVDFLNFYLSQGVVFSTDYVAGFKLQIQTAEEKTDSVINMVNNLTLEDSSHSKPIINLIPSSKRMETLNNLTKSQLTRYMPEAKIEEIVLKLEIQATFEINEAIKEYICFEENPHVLAAVVIAYVRFGLGFKEIWNSELEILTGVKEKEINEKLNNFALRKVNNYKCLPSYLQNISISNPTTTLIGSRVLGELKNTIRMPSPAKGISVKGNYNNSKKMWRSNSNLLYLTNNM